MSDTPIINTQRHLVSDTPTVVPPIFIVRTIPFQPKKAGCMRLISEPDGRISWEKNIEVNDLLQMSWSNSDDLAEALCLRVNTTLEKAKAWIRENHPDATTYVWDADEQRVISRLSLVESEEDVKFTAEESPVIEAIPVEYRGPLCQLRGCEDPGLFVATLVLSTGPFDTKPGELHLPNLTSCLAHQTAVRDVVMERFDVVQEKIRLAGGSVPSREFSSVRWDEHKWAHGSVLGKG